MSDQRRDRERADGLDRGDANLVRRIAAAYQPADRALASRAAFRAGVDARIQRRTALHRWALGAATVAAAALLVLSRAPAPIAPVAPQANASDTSAEEALLALAVPADAEEAALPADYEAIADLFLEGV